MEQPKYKIGQNVWLIKDSEVKELKITAIAVHKDSSEFYYKVGTNLYKYHEAIYVSIVESSIYPSKEELIKSI